MKKYFFTAFIIAFSLSINAQINKYKVFFADKNGVEFNPLEYFDSKAIERRIKHGISLYDITDFPVREDYISQVNSRVSEITTVSRWFNMVFVNADAEQIMNLAHLPFIIDIQQVELSSTLASDDYELGMTYDEHLLLKNQLLSMQGDKFFNNNINGAGVRIAIFDGGFPNVDNSPVFEHIRANKRIIATYDFTKNKEFVYSFNSHGTMVLSCIAGKFDDNIMGLATEAEFLLARTEINREPFSEEENWLAAVEWADKNGADIINSSLGYTAQRYFKDDMNGKKSLVTRAGNLAAQKGILVVNAMGNSGSSKWKVLGAPADADSVLSIGGINPKTGYHQNFSSYGPTADNRRKPNVSAYSTAIVAGKNSIKQAQGTSFSTPLVTGFAACVLQKNPSLKAMELFAEIEKSGALYPYFDYAHGYGLPQASFFTENKPENTEESFKINIENNNISISIYQKYIDSSLEAENYLYYKFHEENGFIHNYFLLKVTENVINIDMCDDREQLYLTVYYKSFIKTIKL